MEKLGKVFKRRVPGKENVGNRSVFITKEGLKCVYKPCEVFDEGENRAPTIIFLHGAGTRGTNAGHLANNSLFKLADLSHYQVFAPLCSVDTWIDCHEKLKSLVEHIRRDPRTDPERVYCVGNSMGGYGTWQLAISMPDAFAVIIPICGGGMAWNTGRLQTTVVRAFHGGADHTVATEESVRMVERAVKKGVDATLTIYPETGHNSWDPTYKNKELFDWMRTVRKAKEPLPPQTEFKDPIIYG